MKSVSCALGCCSVVSPPWRLAAVELAFNSRQQQSRRSLPCTTAEFFRSQSVSVSHQRKCCKPSVHLCVSLGQSEAGNKEVEEGATAAMVETGGGGIGEEENVEAWEPSLPLLAFSDQHRSFFESTDQRFMKNVLDAGSLASASDVMVILGSEAFVDELHRLCPEASIEVAHFSLDVLGSIKEKHDDSRCWCIHTADFSDTAGVSGYDTIFLNHFPIFSRSLAELLNDVAPHCKPGGTVVISLPQGKDRLVSLKQQSKGLLQSLLPDKEELVKMLCGLPFQMISFREVPGFYLVALKKQFPLHVTGEVVHGFGRGSKQLGFPTANLSVGSLPLAAAQLAKGVYYGWAQVIGVDLDSKVHPMVMNLGNCPTFEKNDIATMEVHILHNYGADFHGMELRIAVMGFIREEMKFFSTEELVARIKEDIKFAELQLADVELDAMSDPFFCL